MHNIYAQVDMFPEMPQPLKCTMTDCLKLLSYPLLLHLESCQLLTSLLSTFAIEIIRKTIILHALNCSYYSYIIATIILCMYTVMCTWMYRIVKRSSYRMNSLILAAAFTGFAGIALHVIQLNSDMSQTFTSTICNVKLSHE